MILTIGSLAAQDDYPYPSLSPKGKISQAIGNTILKIEYERPSARNRKIFGELVPWNKVWRTGAGHCTKISFDQSVKVGGQTIKAGKYSLFSIPNPNEWIIIINTDTTLHGSYNYNSEKDVARFIVKSEQSSRYYETLNFDIDLIPNNAKIYISWENTQIHFDFKTTTDHSIETFIKKELISGKNKNSNLYAGAAEYYFYQGIHLSDAILLAEKAIEIDKNNGWARDLKVRIYQRLMYFDKALAEIEKAVEAIKATKYDNEKDRMREMNSFTKKATAIKKLIKK